LSRCTDMYGLFEDIYGVFKDIYGLFADIYGSFADILNRRARPQVEVGGWGRDPKKCTGRDWGMGSSTI